MRQESTATGAAPLLSGIKDEIRSKLGISDIIGRYVQLRRAGKSLVGLCPFHHEKTPSFHVDPQKGLYYCFGCKEGGDLFDFVMKIEGLSFPEALAQLAERAGVELPQSTEDEESRQRRQQKEALAKINALAQAFYSRALSSAEGQEARRYLVQRGVQPETARRFGLGYAPDKWDALTRHLGDADQLRLGVAAGLLVQKENGHFFDRFRGRIMFPLVESSGKVIAFGGRALGKGTPKYLNSPETLLYLKRRELFGWHLAREPIRRNGRVIVVEGYFDCIALHQVGIDYVVASCGTALTEDHVRRLRRVAQEVYICFDGDSAGRSAAARGLDVFRNTGLPVKIVLLPEGHDPDTYVQQEGVPGFLGLMEKALPLTEFLLEEAVGQADLRTVEGRMRGVRAALPILRTIKSPVERDAYMQRIAVRLGVSVRSLALEVAGSNRGQSGFAPERHTNLPNRNTSRDFARSGVTLAPGSPRALLERELLRCLLQDPTGVESVVTLMGEAPFQNEAYNVCLRAVIQGESAGDLANTISGVLGPDAADLVQQADTHVTWEDCLARLRLEHMREELEAMEEGLATLVDQYPVEYIMHISDTLMAYKRWRKALREHFPSPSQVS